MREGKEQHRFEFTWQFTFRLGHPNATQIQIGGLLGNRSDFKTEFEASNKGTWSDLVASSRFVYSPFSKFCFLILFIYVCRVKSR